MFFAQASLVVLAPDVFNIWLTTALSVFQVPSVGGGRCLFPRSYYGKFVQTMASPLISALQCAVILVGLRVVTAIRVVNSTRALVMRPALSLLLSSYAPITSAYSRC